MLCVDDQPHFLTALRELLAAVPEFSCVGEESSGEDAVRAVAAVRPALVLLDVRMPGLGGLEAARAILAQDPAIVVVLMSADHQTLPADLAGDQRIGFVLKQDLGPALLRQLVPDRSTGASRQDEAVRQRLGDEVRPRPGIDFGHRVSHVSSDRVM